MIEHSIGNYMTPNDTQNEKSTVIILLGSPGSGKGTIAAELSKQKNIPHISTGDLFYQNVKNKTDLGLQAQQFLNKGLLVPDNLVLDILYDRISQPDCAKGYILDGIPRNIAQVHELEDYLRHKAEVLAVKLQVSDEVAISRLTGRMLCEKCNHACNTELSAPKEAGVCDLCGGKLEQRSDDTPETIKERLRVYHAQTQPIEKFYNNADALKEIDATKPVDQVLNDILQLC